jgi:hypothetical protein
MNSTIIKIKMFSSELSLFLNKKNDIKHMIVISIKSESFNVPQLTIRFKTGFWFAIKLVH